MKGEATEKYLSTGEFARICGVEKHVLFHYEEIGLFQPVLVLENGYRYYSYHQYDTFVVIRLLRSLGMSLRDIGVYLDQRTPERFLALLREKDRELAREIRRLEDTRRTLDRISARVSEVIGGEKGVHLERLPAARLLLSEDLEDSTDRSFASYMQQYIAFSKEMHPSMQEFVGSMLTVGNIRREEYWNYSYLYMFTDRKSARTHLRPEGLYLCASHTGAYEGFPDTYRALLRFADEQEIPLGKYAYEEYVVADIAEKDSSRYITRLLLETAL